MDLEEKLPKRKAREAALAVTRWIGSLESIVLHTFAFVASFAAVWFGEIALDRMLLVLTTIVSLEAIYLAIFIQMTINYASEDLEEVEHDIDEIQEDIDEIQEDFEELSEAEKAQHIAEEEEHATLEVIREGLTKLIKDVEHLQRDR